MRPAGALSALAAACSAGALVAAHLAMSFDIASQSISDMVHGDQGWLITLGIALLAAAALLLAPALWRSAGAGLAALGMVAVAIGGALAAGFHSPAPELGAHGSGAGHVTGLAIATVALVVVGARLAWSLRDDRAPLAWASAAMIACLVAGWIIRWLLPHGAIVERVVVAIILAWIAFTGLALATRAAQPASAAPS